MQKIVRKIACEKGARVAANRSQTGAMRGPPGRVYMQEFMQEYMQELHSCKNICKNTFMQEYMQEYIHAIPFPLRRKVRRIQALRAFRRAGSVVKWLSY